MFKRLFQKSQPEPVRKHHNKISDKRKLKSEVDKLIRRVYSEFHQKQPEEIIPLDETQTLAKERVRTLIQNSQLATYDITSQDSAIEQTVNAVMEKLAQDITTRIKNEASDLIDAMPHPPTIAYTSVPQIEELSETDKITLKVRINVNNPQSMVHELGHYFDYCHKPHLSARYDFQWIASRYIIEIKKLNLPQWFEDYSCRNEEIFARLFQVWYQDIDNQLNFTKMDKKQF